MTDLLDFADRPRIPVNPGDCFVYTGAKEVGSRGKLYNVTGQIFKCTSFNNARLRREIYGNKYNDTGMRDGYVFPEELYNDIKKVDCPPLSGGARRNKRATKKARRNRRRYSRRR